MSGGPFDPYHDDKLITGGRVSSMPGTEVRKNVMRIFEDGDLVAVISRDPKTGDLSVMVLGPPSIELADALDEAAANYRKALPS
ncbi:MAG: hypothetical protein ACRD3G_12085 [Vicinamibacterales bacterium]